MSSSKQLIYHLSANELGSTSEFISVPIDFLYVAAKESVNYEEIIHQLKKTDQDKTGLILDFDVTQVEKLKPHAVIVDPDQHYISVFKRLFPELKLVVKSASLAAAKNAELMGADVVLMDFKTTSHPIQAPASILGSESFSSFLPKKDPYGWMLFSVNKPLWAIGINTLSELKSVFDASIFSGIVISNQFEPSLSLQEKVAEIRRILG